MRTTPLLGLFLLAACGNERTIDLLPHRTPIEPTATLGRGLHDPVVAADETSFHVAAISDELSWPVFVRGQEIERFPGEVTPDHIGNPRPIESLSMIAAPGGELHAAWADTLYLHYARFDRASLRGAWVRVAECSECRPTLAVRADGTVIIAYVAGHWSRYPTFKMMVVEGTIERGFSEPEHVNPECCGAEWSEENGAYFAGMAGVKVDAGGAIHLAYSWGSGAAVDIDYVVKRDGRWQRVQRLEDIDPIAPNVALELRDDRALLAWISEDQRAIVQPSARCGTARIIPVEGTIRQLRMHVDSRGAQHFLIEYSPDDRPDVTRLMYRGRVEQSGELVQTDEPSETLRLSAGTGGSMLLPSTGELVVPYQRGDDVYVTVLHLEP